MILKALTESTVLIIAGYIMYFQSNILCEYTFINNTYYTKCPTKILTYYINYSHFKSRNNFLGHPVMYNIESGSLASWSERVITKQEVIDSFPEPTNF